MGVEFKNNVKKAWWRKFVQESPYNVGLDSAILMNPQVWVASGHVGGFSDPLMDCRDCKTRHRADKLIEDQTGVSPEGWDFGRMQEFVKEHAVKCPECGSQNFTDIRSFKMCIRDREDYIARRDFTRCVEQDMTNGIIAEAFEMDRDDLKRRRAQSVRNVRATNGTISLEKYARSRQEPDWDDDEWQD